ncbi:MAG: hypothetical protein JXA89_08160 [Anaerolineae bacterium]|nr:hypothetical protein [Anaerolineae bacterium]
MDASARGDWDTTLQALHRGMATIWLVRLGRLVGAFFWPDYDSLALLQQLDIEPICGMEGGGFGTNINSSSLLMSG